ncbi:Gp37-like protein [Rhodococcus sp. NPDC003994]
MIATANAPTTKTTTPGSQTYPGMALYPGTSAVPADTDFDAIFEQITAGIRAEREERIKPPVVRLWDGDWNLRGIVRNEYNAKWQTLDNETGTGSMDLPTDYFMTKWLLDINGRSTSNVHVTVDKDGARWSGRMYSCKVVKGDDGRKFARVLFKHDFEETKHILCYSNPFLPPEIQFPRLWLLFAPSPKWALETTLLVNIMRLESSLWALPDDPMDPAQWFNFDQSTWSMVVKPSAWTGGDGALVHSRFKYFYDVAKRIVADAELSIECRRYLEGDPPPWEGANLRHGCLVWEIVDKSAKATGTSVGGNIHTGLLHEIFSFGSDGMSRNSVAIDPNMPAEYFQPGYKGTRASAPWVIFREGDLTGIQSSEFEFMPATDVGFVAGGKSAPGVNEAQSALVNMVGDLTATIPGAPPMGGVADAVLRPIYLDTLLAFMKHKDIGRAQRLGWSHYHETFAEGGDRAYTLSSLISLRTAQYKTREIFRHQLVVADGCPYRIGQNGYGHFYLGDRVGSTVLGMPDEGLVYVDRVSELVLAWDRDSTPAWQIVIGVREPEDPVMRALSEIQEWMSVAHDLGVN